MSRFRRALVLLLSGGACVLSACNTGQAGSGKQSQIFDSEALFDPTNASFPITPLPFDGLFNGFSTPTLNFPGVAGTALAVINQVDGFSTVAPIFADIAGQLDMSTVSSHVLIVNSATGAVLKPGVDFTVSNENAVEHDPLLKDPKTGLPLFTPISSQRTRLLIQPLKPLAASTTYLVGLTQGMKTVQGGGVVPADQFVITSSTTPVSQQPQAASFTAGQQAVLEALRTTLILPTVQGLQQLTHTAPGQLVLAWSFTTESIRDSLVVAFAQAGSFVQSTHDTPVIAPTGETTALFGGFGLADLYAGTIKIPYYLQTPAAATAANPVPPLTDFWLADPAQPSSGMFLGKVPCGAFAAGSTVNNVKLQPSTSTTACFPVPVQQSVQTLPIIVTAPHSANSQLPNIVNTPAGGWPVVIFQHGITRNREDVLGVADGLAQAGFVVVSADLPLHGITNTSDPLYHNQALAALGLQTGERTFDLDVQNNTNSAPGPDGVIDASGSHFINLASLITSRDNLREGEADLMTIASAVKNDGLVLLIPEGQTVVQQPIAINPARIYYFGHSLGAIVGSTLLGVDTDLHAAVLANPGGGIAKLIDASASIGPEISAGLLAAGVAEGTDDFPPNPQFPWPTGTQPIYETFLNFAQTLVDPGDPVNYAAATSKAHAIDLIEVIGDTVVPNAAPTTCPSTFDPFTVFSAAELLAACPQVLAADGKTVLQDFTINPGPLSGTNPLIATMGLQVVAPITPPVTTADVITGAQVDTAVQFAIGTHGTVLSPAGPGGATQFLAVTEEMQNEAAQFLASDGQCLPVGGSCQAPATARAK